MSTEEVELIRETRPQRLKNLGRVVNNTRFLVFPWVEVAHLASHILGQMARRVAALVVAFLPCIASKDGVAFLS
ncbi:MAG: hypothetical protein AB1578_07520 [Thermodesulfobacteriota bacterium]